MFGPKQTYFETWGSNDDSKVVIAVFVQYSVFNVPLAVRQA